MIQSVASDWTNEDLEQITIKIIGDGEKSGVCLRALGGVAIRLLCEDVIVKHPKLDRKCGDIDLAGFSKETKPVEELLARHGFRGHKEFNFIYESSRLLFSRRGLKIDVLLDEFRMNHSWSIWNRLRPGEVTLPFEDLVLSKLQVVHFTRKDFTDLLTLGLSSLTERADMDYLARVAASSWGFTHTILRNDQQMLREGVEFLGEGAEAAMSFFSRLQHVVKNTRKKPSWYLRALFGERVRWYEPAEQPMLED